MRFQPIQADLAAAEREAKRLLAKSKYRDLDIAHPKSVAYRKGSTAADAATELGAMLLTLAEKHIIQSANWLITQYSSFVFYHFYTEAHRKLETPQRHAGLRRRLHNDYREVLILLLADNDFTDRCCDVMIAHQAMRTVAGSNKLVLDDFHEKGEYPPNPADVPFDKPKHIPEQLEDNLLAAQRCIAEHLTGLHAADYLALKADYYAEAKSAYPVGDLHAPQIAFNDPEESIRLGECGMPHDKLSDRIDKSYRQLTITPAAQQCSASNPLGSCEQPARRNGKCFRHC